GNRQDKNNLAALDTKGSVSTPTSKTFQTGPNAKVDWPTRPLTIVVPFSAGGTADIIGRVVADGLSRGLGQPVVIDNRPGAGGTIGLDSIAKAAPDGYRIALGTVATNAQAPSLYKKLPYNAATDFTPVALLAE